eukprot:TRINITY_DN1223_c0_g1_i1.p1 TRINITY_DN1223_c0_g1~~TRINITY_DN1223_c0_g1_i1.p1  ORF type:complete len:212 (+),score=47.99 TRINITY_DN1223_c0_g1_i1:63-698(+)
MSVVSTASSLSSSTSSTTSTLTTQPTTLLLPASKPLLPTPSSTLLSTSSSSSTLKNVTFETSMGNFSVELYWNEAPKTCNNFHQLSQRGYYDNTIFHRIIRDFVVQGGDPTGTGRGGQSIYGAKFEDELTKKLKHTGAGILSMANSGPNTNGSQFFISLAPTPHLDGKHTIFGRVKTGMKVIQRMGMVSTDATSNRPLEDVKIYKARPSES